MKKYELYHPERGYVNMTAKEFIELTGGTKNMPTMIESGAVKSAYGWVAARNGETYDEFLELPKVYHTIYKRNEGMITGTTKELSSITGLHPSTVYYLLHNKSHSQGWIKAEYFQEYDDILGIFTIRGNAGTVLTGTPTELATKLNKTTERLRVLKEYPITKTGKISRLFSDSGEVFTKDGITL